MIEDLIPQADRAYHPLKLANGMYMHLSRIGYSDEGIRLTFCDDVPHNLHIEVQLSRKDAEVLIKRLQAELEKAENLPE